MGHLRDRLVEAADCMEAGIDVVREAGLTTADRELRFKTLVILLQRQHFYLKVR